MFGKELLSSPSLDGQLYVFNQLPGFLLSVKFSLLHPELEATFSLATLAAAGLSELFFKSLVEIKCLLNVALKHLKLDCTSRHLAGNRKSKQIHICYLRKDGIRPVQVLVLVLYW